MRPNLRIDLSEGQSLAICCIACRRHVVAIYGIATPFRLYVAALTCPECEAQLICFDALSGEVAA